MSPAPPFSLGGAVLQLKPGDRDAVVAKVVAHMKQSGALHAFACASAPSHLVLARSPRGAEYEAALPLLKQPEDAFLRAYCLYRTGANQESLRELQAMKVRVRRVARRGAAQRASGALTL